MSRRKARWLYFLSQFEISNSTLVKGKVNVLGDVLSRNSHSEHTSSHISTLRAVVAHISVSEDFSSRYFKDVTFGDTYRHLKGEDIRDDTASDRVSRLKQHFRLDGDTLLCKGLICIPIQNVKDVLQMAHENPTSDFWLLKDVVTIAEVSLEEQNP